MKLSIRMKLLAGFGAVLALLVAVAIMGIRGMQDIDHELNILFEEDFKLVDEVDELFIVALKAEVSLLEMAEAPSAEVRDAHHEDLTEQLASVDEHILALDAAARNPAERESVGRIAEDVGAFETEVGAALAIIARGDMAAFGEEIEAEVKPTFADMQAGIDEFRDELSADAEAQKDSADAATESATRLLIIVAIVAALTAMAIAWLLSRSMSRNIQEVARAADAVAGGDLTATVDVRSSDEVGALAASITRMIENLREIVGTVVNVARQIDESANAVSQSSIQAGQASQGIADTMQSVAAGATTQTSSLSNVAENSEQLSEASTSVAEGATQQSTQVARSLSVSDEMATAINQVAERAQQVAAVGAAASEAVDKGGKAAEATVTGMGGIREAVNESTERVRELGERSSDIGAIVATISEIADQTNLLALNAAIEAARAGDAGRGFAVVADEVRKLAERSMVATQEISALIEAVQQGTETSVASMDRGAEQVAQGMKVVEDTRRAFDEITSSVSATTQEVESISAATEELTASADELRNSVRDITEVAERNAAAAEQMSAQADDIQSAVRDVGEVSETNAAAAEEVGASTEEVSAQVEEMAAAAEQLANLSDNLADAVSQFKLETGDSGAAAGVNGAAARGAVASSAPSVSADQAHEAAGMTAEPEAVAAG